MATKFNPTEFMKGMVYAPIELGEHTIKIENATAVFDSDDNGKDTSHLLIECILENGRKLSIRHFANGIQIATNQIRQQLNQTDNIMFEDFCNNLKDLSIKCWVSRRTYPAPDGTIKSTLQYDYIEPIVVSSVDVINAEDLPTV
jgi:hypothetical protein